MIGAVIQILTALIKSLLCNNLMKYIKVFEICKINKNVEAEMSEKCKYRRDLDAGLVWYSNGQKVVQFRNGPVFSNST